MLDGKNGYVTNFIRVCKHRTAELAELLDLECIHGGRFKDLRDADPFDELELAMRSLDLTTHSFGSKGENFAQVSAAITSVRKPLTRVRELLAGTTVRLAAVQIETQGFSTILRCCDANTTFFYLHPPYVDFKHNGRCAPMDLQAREQLFSQLAGLRGKFLLSFDDHPEICYRAAAHHFHVCKVTVPYSLGAHAGSRKKVPQLLLADHAIQAAFTATLPAWQTT